MPRFGKKTLYLDLDAIDRIQAVLDRMPIKGSVSSVINEALPDLALQLERVADVLSRAQVDGTPKAEALQELASFVDELADFGLEQIVNLKKMVREDVKKAREEESVPPKEHGLEVAASKPKRQKKSA